MTTSRCRDRGLFLVPITVSLMALGCGDSGDARLAPSRVAWHSLSAAADNTYSYGAPTSSFSGYRNRTDFQIENGIVTYRRFESGSPDPTTDTIGDLTLQWEEVGTQELGSHDGGARIATIDQLYDQCASDVLSRDPVTNDITLTFDDRDVLQTCTYFPKNCADDCAVGVQITDVMTGKRY